MTEPLDLRRTLGGVEIGRDVVRVSGPDAVAYLQGQLSQDVEDLDVGATTWSFVLQPTGKVAVWTRVTRTEGDAYVLDVDQGGGEVLVDRLRRFLLRTKADIEPLDWRAVAVRGPGAEAAAQEALVDAELRLPAGWPGVEGADLLGPAVERPRDITPAEISDYEVLRILSGVPAMGAELTDKTIPAETGAWLIDRSVDFAKGCFTGQELVARIDSRGGNVPRHLRGLLVTGVVPPPPGATVRRDGADIGAVTSAAFAVALDAPVALAYVGRGLTPPADVTVAWAGGEATAVVHPLPFGPGLGR